MLRTSIACLVVLFGLSGCEENLDPATPEGALHLLRDAVLAKDADAMLARTSQATHTRLAELHTLLKEQRAAIDERYPEEHRSAARTAYPAGALAAADSGALFAALIGPGLEALEASAGLSHGLTAMGTPTITDGRAKVATHSGETLEFVLEDDRWVTTAFERPVAKNLGRVRLYQQTLAENLKVFEQLKQREVAREKARAKAAAEAKDAP